MTLLLLVFAFGLLCGWMLFRKPQSVTVNLTLPPQEDEYDETYEEFSTEAHRLLAHAVERKWMH